MKKLIAVILLLSLFIPFSSFADPSLDFFAAYCHSEINKDDSPFFAVLYFTESGNCYYSEKSFTASAPGQDNAYIGTWEYNDDGDIAVKFRQNTVFTLHLLKDGDLINTETMMIYYHVNSIWN